jgi:acetyltransferase-like isoleucine patch superfamily enzyme
VVTKDIPANCVAVGNPCRVIKECVDPLPSPKPIAQVAQVA